MDLYRYFHPHHNPRLKNVPLRLVELGELSQAALELKRALESACIRCQHSIDSNSQMQLNQILNQVKSVVENFKLLTDSHPGDSHSEMSRILKERSNAPGWENWILLLRQRLELIKNDSDYTVPKQTDSNG